MKFLHSGSLGDVVYSLPAVLDLERRHGGGEKSTFFLKPNVPADYYAGCVHPSGKYRMSGPMAASVLPLLISQGFDARPWGGEEVDLDLDLMRSLPDWNYAVGHIPRWYFYAFGAWADLSRPWLAVVPDERYRGRVVVNRTSRYRNKFVRYDFLEAYRPLFVGLPDECERMKEEIPGLEYAPTADLLGAARIVAGCRLFVGNQSVLFAVAEGLKVPRVLEVCPAAPNVCPQGGIAHDAVNQAGFRWSVEDALAE